jgi:hypothetical protein
MKILTCHKHKGCPAEFPDELLDEQWAQRIHGQTLKRLNERGGLSPSEIICNVEKLTFNVLLRLDDQQCVEKINIIISNLPPNDTNK